MKYLFCVFFGLVVLNNIQAQNISGRITAVNNEPLPYSNVSILNKNIGTSADSLGVFNFNVSKHLGDTIFVSQLGYQTKKIPVNSLINQSFVKIILLESQSILDEVLISNKKKTYTSVKTLGVNRSKIKFRSSVPYGYERCLYIENKEGKKGKLSWVSFDLKKKKPREGYDMFPTYYRIKFYEFNKAKNIPDKPLSSFDSIIKPKNKNQKVTINLNETYIPFSNSGICACIEAINPKPNQPKKTMYLTAPNLVVTYNEEALTWSSYRGQLWTHMTRKMKWKAFGKTSYYYANPMMKIGVQFEKQ
ncbi:carboxypeptidase-like regulatory domain-containing protein [Corallibacter sp.]|uniref:carboxypeptidase-like regulatory domain-containing protein n=1 Tax=Corallibacter sp. TaxID=2038084 RepID=UPI003AB7C195